MSTIDLDGDEREEEIEANGRRLFVRARGVTGELTGLDSGDASSRSGANTLLLNYLDPELGEPIAALELLDHDASADNPEKELEITADVGTAAGDVVLLYIDEDGGVRLIHEDEQWADVPADEASGGTGMRSSSNVTFVVPLRPTGVDRAAERGTAREKKSFSLIKYLVEPGTLPEKFRAWEHDHRPLRLLKHDELWSPDIEKPPYRDKISAGTSLVFMHGTFSRTSTGFEGIDTSEFLQPLVDAYGAERIFGFDHPTVATGVATNVMQFFELLEPGEHTIDIICHSRGGLVARAIRFVQQPDFDLDFLRERFDADVERGFYSDERKEWGEAWFKKYRERPLPKVHIRRIIHGAAPNRGTSLAKANSVCHLIEAFLSQAIGLAIPTGISLVAEGALALAGLYSRKSPPILPGIQDMAPFSILLSELTGRPDPKDAAIEVEYDWGGRESLRDRLWEGVTGYERNDWVVPTAGIARFKGVKIDRARVLFLMGPLSDGEEEEDAEYTWHGNLFQHQEMHEFIYRMLVDGYEPAVEEESA